MVVWATIGGFWSEYIDMVIGIVLVFRQNALRRYQEVPFLEVCITVLAVETAGESAPGWWVRFTGYGLQLDINRSSSVVGGVSYFEWVAGFTFRNYRV